MKMFALADEYKGEFAALVRSHNFERENSTTKTITMVPNPENNSSCVLQSHSQTY